MTEKSLKTAIKEETEKEKENILSEAKKVAERLLAEAAQEAELIKQKHRKALELKWTREKQKLLSELKLAVNKEILAGKEKVFNKIIDKVLGQLKNLDKNKEEHYKTLKALVLESKAEFPEALGLKIKVSAQDLELGRKIIQDLNLAAELEARPDSAGGIILCDRAGEFICNNTFESRLKNILPELRKRLYEVLLKI